MRSRGGLTGAVDCNQRGEAAKQMTTQRLQAKSKQAEAEGAERNEQDEAQRQSTTAERLLALAAAASEREWPIKAATAHLHSCHLLLSLLSLTRLPALLLESRVT